MIELITKYEIGGEVYTIAQKRFSIPCPMCSASKIITYNNITVECPNCHGSGAFETDKAVWAVVDDIQIISAIKANIYHNGNIVKYKLHSKSGYGGTLNRCEEAIFNVKADAVQECINRNKVYKNIKIEDIKITSAFSNGIPAPEKIAKRVEEYKKSGKFHTDIIINEEGYLLDGYSAYLVCKMLGIETLNATVQYC